MYNEKGNIEDLFGNAFREAEVAPPQNIWNDLEGSLNDYKVEAIYSKNFKNAIVAPSNKVWKRISKALFLRSFLQFNPTTFNAYYLSLATIVGGVAAYNLIDSESNVIESPEILIEQTKDLVYANKEDLQIDDKVLEDVSVYVEKTAEEQVFEKTEIPKDAPEITKPVFEIATKDKSNKISKAEAEFQSDLQNASFEQSNGAVCENVSLEMRINGIPNKYKITWELGSKEVAYQTYGNVVVASWKKAGTYTVNALVSYNGLEANYKKDVTVSKLSKPQIKGPRFVCEGQKSVVYYIDAPVDKNIDYFYDETSFEGSEVTQKSVKQALVDWEAVGNDTLFVTKVDKISGCKTDGKFAVKVRKAPSVNFILEPLGNGDFEFIYDGNSRNVKEVNWVIEGEELEGDAVVITNHGVGHSLVSLEVVDKNKCVSKVQKEVSFYDYIIKVPEMFTPTIDFDSRKFLPLTNTPMREYKIEIFDARGNLVWKSEELNEGKPAEGWDGMIGGKLAPEGKYLWKIQAEFADGIKYKGVKQPNGTSKPSKLFVVQH